MAQDNNNDTAQDLFDQPEDAAQGQNGDNQGGDSNDSQSQDNTNAQTGKDVISGLSPDQLKAIVSGAIQDVRKQSPAQTDDDDELTPEKLAKLIQPFNPDDALLTLLSSEKPEDRKQALMLLADGTTRQAIQIAQLQMQRQLKALTKQIEGDLGFVKSFARQQAERELVDEFYKSYPQYKGMDPLLQQIKSAMEAEGVKFNSKKEAFAAVHSRAQAVLKSLKVELPNGDDATEDTAQQRPVANQRRMPTLTGGGQGGAGGGQKSGGGTSSRAAVAKELFG